MVRKRITKNGSKGKGKKPRPLNRSDAKMKRWNTISDIPMDDEEQFHADRDKILFDGGDQDEDLDQVDEVFGLKGLSEDSDDDEEVEEDQDEEDEETYTEPTPSKSLKKKKSKQPSSDSEEEESELEEGWGNGRGAYYSSNAAQIESDDEEANELEEQEAVKIQAKARDVLNADDFGLGEIVDDDSELSGNTTANLEEEPDLHEDPQDALRYLQRTSPETIALARDWEDTAHNMMRAKKLIEQLSEDGDDSQRLGEVHFHYQTLLTYATTLAFYFYLQTNPKYSRKPELLKTHPIMTQLLTLKSALSQLESAGFAAWDDPEDDEETKAMFDAVELWRLAQAKGLEKDELEELLRDANIVTDSPPSEDDDEKIEKEAEKKRKKKKVAGTPVQPVVPSTSAPPKKKRKTEKEPAMPLPVFDLVEPEFVPLTKARTTTSVEDDAYGEVNSLQFADAADKKSRRKTLRFHTSKIESTTARRQGARAGALGGDDDIPYRERKRDREARLVKEAAAKGLGLGGEDLDDVEPELPESKKRRRNDDDDGDEEEAGDYYDLIKKKSAEKKSRKKADYEAERAATRPDFEEESASGPRSLTRAILKNKGLTPHRSKSVRNPRVKKREKFEKAKKKVASQKAVYKGGVGPSGKYEGERTGITKVAKGIKLS